MVIATALLLLVAPAPAGAAEEAALQPAPVLARIAAPEARQGVASDGTHVYAVGNSEIGKYEVRTGRRVARWSGDPALFPHINSCAVVGPDLVCAASNYPAVPQTSVVEIFDMQTLRHKASRSLGPGTGSLTVLDWHEGRWWAVFANYDGKGGEPGRDHRATTLVRMDAEFRREAAWLFPADILARIAPKSISGAAWGLDGRLYVSGHDRPEIYVMTLPEAGSVLTHVGTIGVATHGQAIDWDANKPWSLWSIDRAGRVLFASDLSAAEPAR